METKPSPAAPTETVTQTVAMDRPKLLSLLGLAPEATDAELEGVIVDLRAKAGETATAQSSLSALSLERDALRAQYEELFEKQTTLDKKQREAEADAALEPVKSRVSAEQLGKLRELYISSPDAAKFHLELLQTAASAEAVATTGKGEPPKPVHDPSKGDAGAEKTAEAKASEAESLIKAVQKEGKFKDYSSAREEARRRSPELFQ